MDVDDKTCEWSVDDEGVWTCSKCDIAWEFINDGPMENGTNFCPKCGREIVKVNTYQEEVDAEDKA